MEILFLLAACVSILAVILICVFLFANGIPGMAKIGVFKFLAGEKWKPGNDIYGILPMILGSIYVTVGAIIIGVPVGIFTAVFMAKFCPKKIYPYLKQAIDLLAGIPSVVYGFFGLVVIVPMVRELTDALHAVGDGTGILTASILLGLMILPTIIGVSEPRSGQCRKVIMKALWHSEPIRYEVYFLLHYRQQNPESWQV